MNEPAYDPALKGPLKRIKRRIQAWVMRLLHPWDVRLAQEEHQTTVLLQEIGQLQATIGGILERMASDDMTTNAISEQVGTISAFARENRQRVDQILERMASDDATTNAISERVDAVSVLAREDRQRVDQILERMASDDETTRSILERETLFNEQLKNIKAIAQWNARNTEKRSAPQESVVGQPAPAKEVDPLFYHDLEERFRGSQAMICQRLQAYLPLIENISEKQVLDLGCGRGEWLDVLREQGVTHYIGVDVNELQLAICSDKGHRVQAQDCLQFLNDCEDCSYDVITAFQLIEHLPFPVLLELFAECYRVLTPGGTIIFETPNSSNIVTAASNFYLDPTHERPLHKELIRFIAERTGYQEVQIVESSPVEQEQWLQTGNAEDSSYIDRNFMQINELLYGPRDYAVIARK